LDYYNLNKLSSKELLKLAEEQFNLCKQDLNKEDILQAGSNWVLIFSVCSDPIPTEMKFLAENAFASIRMQAAFKGINYAELYSWSSVPVYEVLQAYYEGFDVPAAIGCGALNNPNFSKEEVISLAEICVANMYLSEDEMLLENLLTNKYPEVQALGVERMKEMSKNTQKTHDLCVIIQDNSFVSDVVTKEVLDDARKTILDNHKHHFTEKYLVFLGTHETSVSAMAFEHLLAATKEAVAQKDLVTLEYIQSIADHLEMENKDRAAQLRELLP
jgi:hypothetical protein